MINKIRKEIERLNENVVLSENDSDYETNFKTGYIEALNDVQNILIRLELENSEYIKWLSEFKKQRF